MDAGDILGHCWCLRKVLAKSLSMPPLAYSPPASPDAGLPDSPTPCGHEAPVLWRTDSTFFLVGGGLAWAPAGPPRLCWYRFPRPPKVGLQARWLSRLPFSRASIRARRRGQYPVL